MKKVLVFTLCVIFSVALYSQKSSRAFMNNFYDAVAYMYEDNYDAALLLWQEALNVDPENPNVWYNLGVCYNNTSKDREMAVEYLQKSLDFATADYVSNDHNVRTAPLEAYMEYGKALRMVGKYDESLEVLEKAKKLATENNKTYMLASVETEINISKNIKMHSEQKACRMIEVINIGETVNSEYSDHSPSIVCDGTVLYFTSKRPSSMCKYGCEKIYVTRKTENGWSSPEMLPHPINTSDNNESVVSVTGDGKQLYFFRSGSGMQGNLYVSELNDNGKWGKPHALSSEINTKYRETHVTLSPDGNSMYFTSDRPNGIGGQDIYVMKKLENDKWSEPQVLPVEVNTENDEECPFVHPNGSVLYFCSKGHDNIGGYDVFFSKINEDGTFSKAESMCTPINTSDNDICYTLSCDGITGYIAAIREDSYGEYDIYMISDIGEAPSLVAYKGVVKYADSTFPMGMQVWVKDKSTGEDLGSYNIDVNTGEFVCNLKPDVDYNLTISRNGNVEKEIAKTTTKNEEATFKKSGQPISLGNIILPLFSKSIDIAVNDKGELTTDAINSLTKVVQDVEMLSAESRKLYVYLNFDENVMKNESAQISAVTDFLTNKGVEKSIICYNDTTTNRNIYAVNVLDKKPLVAGNDVVASEEETKNLQNPVLTDTLELENVYFDFDKYDIKDEYKANLDKLAKFMIEYPAVKIEIGGHTDDIGTTDYNYLLSGRRAKAVKDYLVSKGVKQDKIETVKYGETKPAAKNTSALRKYNRRAEFRVLEQGNETFLRFVDGGNSNLETTYSNGLSSVSNKYVVQILSLKNFKDLSAFNVPNLKVDSNNGIHHYYLGELSSKAEAEATLETVKDRFPDAYIIRR